MSILDWYRRVQYTVGTGEHPVIESLKKQAKTLHRQYPNDFTLMAAQDHVAQQHGFLQWHHAQQVAANYKKVYDASLQKVALWQFRSPLAKAHTMQELRDTPARWIGFDELGPWHFGQHASQLRAHTLVTGPRIGPVYFKQWLQNHLRKNEPFLAWLNCSAWPTYTLPVDSNQTLRYNTNPSPQVVRLGTSALNANLQEHVQAVEIQWSALSEMHAWVNILRPTLASTQQEAHLLTTFLAWLWNESGPGYKTGASLLPFLRPAILATFPRWQEDQHKTLVFAGELAQLFRSAQPFNASNEANAVYMTIDQWLAYPPGTIVLDDGGPEQEDARLCVQAWLRSNLGHRLGVPIEGGGVRKSNFRFNYNSYWYIANTELAVLPMHLAAQCRALGVAMTYFYDTEPQNEAHKSMRANTLTKLVQSPHSPMHVLYDNGNPDACVAPLRISGPGINASEPNR